MFRVCVVSHVKTIIEVLDLLTLVSEMIFSNPVSLNIALVTPCTPKHLIHFIGCGQK